MTESGGQFGREHDQKVGNSVLEDAEESLSAARLPEAETSYSVKIGADPPPLRRYFQILTIVTTRATKS